VTVCTLTATADGTTRIVIGEALFDAPLYYSITDEWEPINSSSDEDSELHGYLNANAKKVTDGILFVSVRKVIDYSALSEIVIMSSITTFAESFMDGKEFDPLKNKDHKLLDINELVAVQFDGSQSFDNQEIPATYIIIAYKTNILILTLVSNTLSLNMRTAYLNDIIDTLEFP
jgi:hypothetical protein